jgi:hypothetical protein
VESDKPPSSNAVMQCGKVIGYVVEDEEGRPLLVDEGGVPVRKEHAGRTPVPPAVNDDGSPRWAVGSGAEAISGSTSPGPRPGEGSGPPSRP